MVLCSSAERVDVDSNYRPHVMISLEEASFYRVNQERDCQYEFPSLNDLVTRTIQQTLTGLGSVNASSRLRCSGSLLDGNEQQL